MLGKLVARSMLDSRIIDISFNPAFFRILDGITAIPASLKSIKYVDEGLAKSLKLLQQFAFEKARIHDDTTLTTAERAQKIQDIQIDGARVEDLGLDFTLPGYPDIELIPNGSHIPVTIENVELYLEKVIDMTLGRGVKRQVEAFRTGFSQVFPYSALSAFTPSAVSAASK